MKNDFIPVAAPSLVGNEKAYVMDCLDTTWISSNGKYISLFEDSFADFCGVKHAITCCNGTVALHLALLALGIGVGDEVLVPTLTFVASANAVTYCGAKPIFIDSESQTWNIDPTLLEASITPRTKAIIVVHLYGHPADMDPILAVARQHNLFVIEDAAEAHGAEYKGIRVGGLGDIATFSFFGNKIITTGEGGMVTTNNHNIANRIRQLKGQGVDPERRYWFPIIGYNYRMTNIAAAIGLAQLEKVDWHLQRRHEVVTCYYKHFQNTPGISFQTEQAWAKHANWIFSITLNDDVPHDRDNLMAWLYDNGIETRPLFYPMHTLPPYAVDRPSNSFPVADRLARRGISLPTWAGLTDEDIYFVSERLQRHLATI